MNIKKKVVILCQDKDSSRFIINYLGKYSEIVYVVFEQFTYMDWIKKIFRRFSRDGFLKVLERMSFLIFYRIFEYNAESSRFRKVLYEEIGFSEFRINNNLQRHILKTRNINEHSVVSSVLRMNPDVIIVFGISILKSGWLQSKIPLLNIHYGLSDYYRGSFCGFWALYNQEFDRLGVCIHAISEHVDSGEIIVQKRMPQEHKGQISDLGTLLAFQGLLSAEALREALSMDLKKCEIGKAHRKNSGKFYFIPELSKFLKWKLSAM